MKLSKIVQKIAANWMDWEDMGIAGGEQIICKFCGEGQVHWTGFDPNEFPHKSECLVIKSPEIIKILEEKENALQDDSN